jgi:uncharacterized membrane protein
MTNRHPVIKAHDAHRQARLQDRLADLITRFAGSMSFVFVDLRTAYGGCFAPHGRGA